MSPQIVLGSSLPQLACTWSRCSRPLAARSRRWTPSLCWEWTPDQVGPIRFVEEKLDEREESKIQDTRKRAFVGNLHRVRTWGSPSTTSRAGWHPSLTWLYSFHYLVLATYSSNRFTRDYNEWKLWGFSPLSVQEAAPSRPPWPGWLCPPYSYPKTPLEKYTQWRIIKVKITEKSVIWFVNE